MAHVEAMSIIKTVLLTSQGATGKMLSDGLMHSLQDRPEERHELQVQLLKMVAQVLTAAQSTAKLNAEETCQQNVDTAKTELQVRQAAMTRATEALQAAEATVQAQKQKLEASRSQLMSEVEECTRVKAEDDVQGQVLVGLEASKLEVLNMLELMGQKGSGETIMKYLQSAKAEAEAPLVAALRSVLEKEPADRCGFDLFALENLQSFLQEKVAHWDAQLEKHGLAKANIHAEALGAWAVKEVAGEHVREAELALKSAEETAEDARQKLQEAREAAQEQDKALAQNLTDLTLAGEGVRHCSAAVEALVRLQAGQDLEQEVAEAQPMEVELELPANMLDVEMGLPIAA